MYTPKRNSKSALAVWNVNERVYNTFSCVIVFVFIRELEKHRVNSATDIAKKRQEAESAVSIREHNAYRPFNRVYN